MCFALFSHVEACHLFNHVAYFTLIFPTLYLSHVNIATMQKYSGCFINYCYKLMLCYTLIMTLIVYKTIFHEKRGTLSIIKLKPGDHPLFLLDRHIGDRSLK